MQMKEQGCIVLYTYLHCVQRSKVYLWLQNAWKIFPRLGKADTQNRKICDCATRLYKSENFQNELKEKEKKYLSVH
jgi:hypothetical protein